MSNLSLLSRGTGQVIRRKQEKLEVHFDPQDDLDWMPPEGLCNGHRPLDHRPIAKETWGPCPPKTYCTRKGTLFLYSEDGVEPWKWKLRKKRQTLRVDLHTLRDLARAILVYGGKQLWQDKGGMAQRPYLYFLRESDRETERSMRPGYSAKRYLLKLAQSWDPGVLQKLQNAGYISDPLLFKENATALRKKLQDLSTIPPKYNLRIFYTPCWYSQSELEEQAYSGLGPPARKKSENKACLVKDDTEHNARETGRTPFRISVRKLSFHLPPQPSRESVWHQNEAPWQISEDGGIEGHQDGRTEKEPHDRDRPDPPVRFPLLGTTQMDPSEFWCEQSHVNSYGGFFPGKKLTHGVNQNHLKSTASRGGGGGPSEDTDASPLVNPGGSKEQGEVTKKHRKQVPESCQLPQIAESSASLQREEIKPSQLSKDLVILPLLVPAESPAKAKSSGGTCFKEVNSETDVSDKRSALLPKDLVSDAKHGSTQKEAIDDGLLRAPQDTFRLPLINPGKFALKDGKERKREAPTGTDNTEQRESHNKSTSLNILLTGPNGEGICPSLLRSDQTAGKPRGFGPSADGEGDDAIISIEVRRPVSGSPPEICSEGQASDEKETIIQPSVTLKNGHYAPPADERRELPLTQQTQHLPRSGAGFENDKVTTGKAGVSAEFGERQQPSQTGLGRNNDPQPSEVEKGYSSLSQTHSMKRRNASDIMQDTSEISNRSRNIKSCSSGMTEEGEPLDSSARSDNLLHREPRLARLKISASETKQAPNPDYDSIKPFDYHEEVMENPRVDWYASEILGVEEDMTALSESTSQPAAVARLKQTEGVLKSKRTERPKKQPRQKAGDGLKKQKKRLKKEKDQSQTEFVVGKPREKRTIRKTMADSKREQPTVAKRSASVEEETHEKDVEPITCLVEEQGEAGGAGGGAGEGAGGGGDQSLPDSSIFMEEPPLTLDMNQTFSEEVGPTSGFHPGPASETSVATYKEASTANGSQGDAEQGNQLMEDVSLNKEELKRSRDRLIAERAEKRRLAVEAKRREQEERKREEQDEQKRLEKMRDEMEQEKQRRIEEFRLRKQQLEAERLRQEEEAERERQAEKAAQEQARRLQEEQRRRILELQREKQAQELERAEAEKRRQKELEMQLREEQRQLAEMAEEQRLEYEKRKKEKEEAMRLEAEERRRRAEEEARVALEEARQQALLLSRQMAELEKEQRLRYQLLVEACGLDRRQDISRPWVYSYFQRLFTTEEDSSPKPGPKQSS